MISFAFVTCERICDIYRQSFKENEILKGSILIEMPEIEFQISLRRLFDDN